LLQICQCCRVLVVALAIEVCQRQTSSLRVVSSSEDDFYPISGADATNFDCKPAPRRVLLTQLGRGERLGRRRNLSLHESRRSSHRKSHRATLMDTEGSANEPFEPSTSIDADDLMTLTLGNVSSRHGHSRHSHPKRDETPSTSLMSSSRNTGREVFESLPWKCQYKPRWVKMADDIFPPYIQTGDCEQTGCYFGMYVCRPQKYVIKVLKRKKHQRCNPLPVEGGVPTWEEAWEESKIKVVTGCECGLNVW
jgi:hypothetical protein